MKRAQILATVIVLAAFLGGALVARTLLGSNAATTSKPAPVPQPNAKEKSVFALINKERTKRGIPALKYDATMARLALAHNEDMIVRNYFSHDEPNGGPTYAQRVHSVLVMPGRNTLGENIVYGNGPYGTAAGLVKSWMASPPHKANILDRAFHRTGLGIATARGVYQGDRGVTVATQDFSN